MILYRCDSCYLIYGRAYFESESDLGLPDGVWVCRCGGEIKPFYRHEALIP